MYILLKMDILKLPGFSLYINQTQILTIMFRWMNNHLTQNPLKAGPAPMEQPVKFNTCTICNGAGSHTLTGFSRT